MSPPGGSALARASGLAPAVASTAVFATLWLPWAHAGTTERSAFRLVSALRGAGLMARTPAEALFATVAVLPGLAAATWLLWAARCRRASAAAAIVVGALSVAATLTVRAVAHHRATGSLSLATAAGAAALALGTAVLFTSRKAVA
jgi:hypothetical protein